MSKIEIQEKIKQLENNLTGDMFKDMDIKDEIHELEMNLNNVSVTCSMHEGCISCSG